MYYNNNYTRINIIVIITLLLITLPLLSCYSPRFQRRYLLKNTIPALSSMSILSIYPNRANAERTLGTLTESYNRYAPRMNSGFAYLKDMERISKEGGTKEEKEDLLMVLTQERGTQISALKGTTKIFSTSFSDSVVTTTTRELQLARLKMIDGLDKIVNGLRADRLQMSEEGWREAVYYGDVYVSIANGSLPRTLEPIVGPKGEASKRIRDKGEIGDIGVNGAF
mmetsp:Transcript_29/g.43  ORF Transcript_29/g.43 Transcript_29/m.43 type:complete len:225 (-) Transcript_29:83-757(-)